MIQVKTRRSSALRRFDMVFTAGTRRTFLRLVVLVGALSLFVPAFAQAPAAQGPSELIDTVAHQVLTELDARRAEMRKDPKKIRKLVDDLLLPHFDTEYSARQVLGAHWREASADQRKRFIEAFYQSLL